jgi:hypothetical protein
VSDPTRPDDETRPRAPVVADTDDRVAALAAYFRTNSARFTDEALTRAALEGGYGQAEIDAARQLAAPGWQAGAAASVGPRKNYWVVAGVAIAYVVALYLAISGLASMSNDLSGTVGLVGLLLGITGWGLLRNREPSIAQGLGCGVVLAVTIPVVAILVIIGICVASGAFRTSG